MKEKEPKQKRGRGRPRIYVMPEQIPDTPENIARACMQVTLLSAGCFAGVSL